MASIHHEFWFEGDGAEYRYSVRMKETLFIAKGLL